MAETGLAACLVLGLGRRAGYLADAVYTLLMGGAYAAIVEVGGSQAQGWWMPGPAMR